MHGAIVNNGIELKKERKKWTNLKISLGFLAIIFGLILSARFGFVIGYFLFFFIWIGLIIYILVRIKTDWSLLKIFPFILTMIIGFLLLSLLLYILFPSPPSDSLAPRHVSFTKEYSETNITLIISSIDYRYLKRENINLSLSSFYVFAIDGFENSTIAYLANITEKYQSGITFVDSNHDNNLSVNDYLIFNRSLYGVAYYWYVHPSMDLMGISSDGEVIQLAFVSLRIEAM